jgi:hypothetical protein
MGQIGFAMDSSNSRMLSPRRIRIFVRLLHKFQTDLVAKIRLMQCELEQLPHTHQPVRGCRGDSPFLQILIAVNFEANTIPLSIVQRPCKLGTFFRFLPDVD